MGVTYIVNGVRVDPFGNPVDKSPEPAVATEPTKPQEPAFDPADVTDAQLSRLTKPKLQAVAAFRGVEVSKDAKNDEIIEALMAASTEGDGDGDGDASGDGDGPPAGDKGE